MAASKRKLVEILVKLGNEFTKEDAVQKLMLSPSTIRKYLKSLKNEKLIEEISENRYRITSRAAFYLEGMLVAPKNVSEDKAYIFTDNAGTPVILKVNSLEKLYIVIKHNIVPNTILHYHLVNGYLVRWIMETLGAVKLAEKLKHAKDINELLEIIEEYMLITKGGNDDSRTPD
ncbi:MAG: hypothetical protein N3D82_00510 [Ignisphaera sp.]|nr:hypothetical protein [Ignisphaera sp.]MCX8167498.1 hypothetical protein [Ignisphaera sp.]MDW8084638.1 hypothetical protein [Ignisphaera sp.]